MGMIRAGSLLVLAALASLIGALVVRERKAKARQTA